jgi:hypothetical protein
MPRKLPGTNCCLTAMTLIAYVCASGLRHRCSAVNAVAIASPFPPKIDSLSSPGSGLPGIKLKQKGIFYAT